MKFSTTALVLAAGLMVSSSALAQPAPTGSAATAPETSAPTGADANPAVATTKPGSPQPAHGANSFTKGQATARLRRHGYSNVAGLAKDKQGVWRGTATKDGAQVDVWLDYKGSVGEK